MPIIVSKKGGIGVLRVSGNMMNIREARKVLKTRMTDANG
jgi:hypothetical protein